MAAYSSPRTGERPLPLLPRSMASISDRVLVHAKVSDLANLEALIDPAHSGIVVTGKPSAKEFKRFHREFPATPLLLDVADYEDHRATRETPFAKDDNALMSSLASQLDVQRDNRAPVAITPTRFIDVGAHEVLRTVLEETAELGRNDTLCLLPLHVHWLREDTVTHLIERLADFPIPTVLMLGHPMNPLGTRYARLGLRALFDNIPRLSLFRTDMAAFEVLSRGGLTASIGVRGSLRHIQSPGTKSGAPSTKVDRSPHVLLPELLQWVKGRRFADDLVDDTDITCDCRVCNGDSLKRFVDQDTESKRIAERHAVACWMPMVDDLAQITQFNDRVGWWQEKCTDAFVTGEQWRKQFGLSAKPSSPIQFWAGQ